MPRSFSDVEVAGGDSLWPDAIRAAHAVAEAAGVAPPPAKFPVDAYPVPSALVSLAAAEAVGPVSPRVLPVEAPEDGPLAAARAGAIVRSGRRIDADARPFTLGAEDRDSMVGGRHDDGFATVIVRTQGLRLLNLEEALTSLAAQSDDGFDVVVTAHTDDDAAEASVHQVVGSFADAFRSRVLVVRVEPGQRGRPLNAGLDRATGDYVCFLDDDDVVTADWIEAFRAGSQVQPEMVIRSRALVQPVTRLSPPADGYDVAGKLDSRFDRSFDLTKHLVNNSTPIFSVAVPAAVITSQALRFDEELPVLEDWDFLMRAALVVGVHDTDRVTGVYHWWVSGESSFDRERERWATARRRVHARLDTLTRPTGMASRLADLHDRLLSQGRDSDEIQTSVRALADDLQARGRPAGGAF
ncbi:MAG TPA: glycosyltransferase family A protein [Acidimicrobiia bacterium]|nr:glycosyltransferase family A protein [Acidimicrobiia bacterium]